MISGRDIVAYLGTTAIRIAVFRGLAELEAWTREHGLSLGRLQRDDPQGILIEDADVQKWRLLSEDDRAALDGIVVHQRSERVSRGLCEVWGRPALLEHLRRVSA